MSPVTLTRNIGYFAMLIGVLLLLVAALGTEQVAEFILAPGVFVTLMGVGLVAISPLMQKSLPTKSADSGSADYFSKALEKPDIDAQASRYDALAKLKSLHDSGAISDEEFQNEKKYILER